MSSLRTSAPTFASSALKQSSQSATVFGEALQRTPRTAELGQQINAPFLVFFTGFPSANLCGLCASAFNPGSVFQLHGSGSVALTAAWEHPTAGATPVLRAARHYFFAP
mgnify:CR=1 FL=1